MNSDDVSSAFSGGAINSSTDPSVQNTPQSSNTDTASSNLNISTNSNLPDAVLNDSFSTFTPSSNTPSGNNIFPSDKLPSGESDIQAVANQEPQTIVTSPHSPTKYGGKKVIATIFGVLILISSVAIGVSLVKKRQQIAQKAAGGAECSQSSDCILLDNPQNSGEYIAPKDIDFCEISGGQNVEKFDATTKVSQCYEVNIVNSRLTWNKIGSGAECKDISNIRVWLKKAHEEGIEWLLEQLCSGIKISVNKQHEKFTVLTDFKFSSDNDPWTELVQKEYLPGDAQTYYHDVTRNDWIWMRVRINYGGEIVKLMEYRKLACQSITPTETQKEFTPTPTTAQGGGSTCQIKIYNTNWKLLTPSALKELEPGDKIRFAVDGTGYSLAQFSVNGVARDSTSKLKPGTKEFYDEYTIPEDVTTFNICVNLLLTF